MSAGSVLVVGAGPVGLTAAIELSALGVPVRIVERRPAPLGTSRAVAVQARTLELLARRGLADALRERGNPVSATAFYGDGRRLGALDHSRAPSRFDYSLLLPQSDTERLLAEQLGRQHDGVERGVELVAFSQERGGGVRAVLKHRDGRLEEVDAAYLISAEGAHSTARGTLGLPFSGRSLPQSYVLADVRAETALPPHETAVFVGSDGYLTALPLGGGRLRVVSSDPAGHGAGAPDPDLREITALWERFATEPARLTDLTWSARFRISSRHLGTLRAGAVFFGGDAAHVHSPAGGQGMNTGVQDMVNLCWKLAAVLGGSAREELLRTYDDERMPVIRRLVRVTESATDALNSTNRAVHAALTRLLPVALRQDALQARSSRAFGQLGLGYSRNALAAGGGSLGSLRAGDRIPDLDVRPVEGGDERPLHELVDPDRPTLLVLEPADGSREDPLRVWDPVVPRRHVRVSGRQTLAANGAPARRLRERGALVLARPDLHIGAVSDRLEPAPLERWLDRWFIRPPGRTAAA